MKNLSIAITGIMLFSLIGANVSIATNDVLKSDSSLQIIGAPDTSNVLVMAQKGSKRKSLSKSSSKSSSKTDAPSSVSSTTQPQYISHWVTAKNSDCKILIDNSVTDPSCTWTGRSVDGVASGCGELVIYNSQKIVGRYKGEMKKGRPHGFGIYTEENSNTYEGSFKDGVMDGKGKYSINSPDIYSPITVFRVKATIIGEFSNNQPKVVTYQETEGSYSGEFPQWAMNGKGVFEAKDIKYEGEFANNQFHGFGILHYTTHALTNQFKGRFSKGKPQTLGLKIQKILGVQPSYTNPKAQQAAEEAQRIASRAEEIAKNIEPFLKSERSRIAIDIERNVIIKKAEEGDVNTMVELASLYAHGKKNFAQNFVESAKWYHLAAERGNAQAQYYFAHLLLEGKGVEQNRDDAEKWFRESANKGYSSSSYKMGELYEDKFRQSQDRADYVEAKWWYSKSAELKHEKAQKKLDEFQQNELIEKYREPVLNWLSQIRKDHFTASREENLRFLCQIKEVAKTFPSLFNTNQKALLNNVKYVTKTHLLKNPNWDGQKHGHFDRFVMEGLANTVGMGDQSYKKIIDEFHGTVYEGELALLGKKMIWKGTKQFEVTYCYTIDDPEPVLTLFFFNKDIENIPYEDISILGKSYANAEYLSDSNPADKIVVVDSQSRVSGVETPVTWLDIGTGGFFAARFLVAQEATYKVLQFLPSIEEDFKPQNKNYTISKLEYIEANPLQLTGVNGGTKYKVDFTSGKVGYLFEQEGVFDNSWKFWKGSSNALGPHYSRSTKEQAIEALYESLH